jgi:hypothetical protein
MSYDIELADPLTGAALELDAPHHMRGGTYAIGGCPTAALNITYNYAPHYYKTICAEKGIRAIYGKTGAESIAILKSAIEQLGDDMHDDYWQATEGNAKRALTQLLALAQMRPDGVWQGD